MKALTTVGQAHEQIKDREAQRQTYIHRHAHTTRKDHFEQEIKRVEDQIRTLKAMRLA